MKKVSVYKIYMVFFYFDCRGVEEDVEWTNRVAPSGSKADI